MAKIVITIEDGENKIVNYESVCDTPLEIDENGEPTPALQIASKLIDNLIDLSEKNQVE